MVVTFKIIRCIPPAGAGGGSPRKIGWGCEARFPKPLRYL